VKMKQQQIIRSAGDTAILGQGLEERFNRTTTKSAKASGLTAWLFFCA